MPSHISGPSKSLSAIERSWLRLAVYALAILSVIGPIAYVLITYSGQNIALEITVTRDPTLVVAAVPPAAGAQQSYDQAISLVLDQQWQKALPLLGSVGRYASDPALRAKALLLAGVLIHVNGNDPANAASLFRFILEKYPHAEGEDKVRYHLAIIELDSGKLAEADALLTTLLRDTPGSSLAPSAAYLAAETAKVLATREQDPKLRIGREVAKALPSEPSSFIAIAIAIVGAIGASFLSYKDHLRRGRPIAVVAVLAVIALTGYITYVNQEQQARVEKELARVASLLERR